SRKAALHTHRNSGPIGDFPTSLWSHKTVFYATVRLPSGCRLVDRAPEHPRLPWTKTQEFLALRLRVGRQKFFRGCPVVRIGQISIDDLVREVRQHQQFDILPATGERVELWVLRQ